MSVGVTILGGFLGAGKTTALNRLLRGAQGRVAVLVNDFGAVNIDAALIEARNGNLIALSNGCVCCSIGDDFSAGLARVLAYDPKPERVIIEASGVADPWRIAQIARLETQVTLDAVIVLVDATNFPILLADRRLTDTLERQIGRADLIALAKCDLADAAAIAASHAAVRRIRPGVPIFEISDGRIPWPLTGAPAPASRFVADTPDHGFRSWHWNPETPLDREVLTGMLATLPPSILRAKGICRIGPDAAPHLLQLVGARWTLEPWSGPDGDVRGIVFIGSGDFGGWPRGVRGL